MSSTNPLWMQMETRIRELGDQDIADANREATVQRLARELDEAGLNVAGHAGNMLELRAAVAERAAAGRPLLDDFEQAVGKLQLDDVVVPQVAAARLAVDVGRSFPLLTDLDRRGDLEAMMVQKRLDLLIAAAKERGGEQAVRYLIEAEVDTETIIAALGIDKAAYDDVVAKMAAEAAERKRVRGLLEEVADKDDIERVKHLLKHDVADDLIVELAGVPAATIAEAKEAMAAELAEKKRLEEEAAARKKAEAEGPALEDIADDDMLEHIEAIREIMEFSDVEQEIRTMCEQSNIPKCLIDIAVTDADKLDDLESKAGG